eukprot:CAMPEP_0171627660 /NCGR_PEP_ID=MMETSP0990-20121206/20912_1 /TAXON_ID=483369 /ORGANISM="non described non described, Strain CCMP2098" /LENGTH=293 /DNA_ID=CAMNT_0012195573 /DNA_START=146 /DNA_END=1027 /DNA_ORIENTATION=-
MKIHLYVKIISILICSSCIVTSSQSPEDTGAIFEKVVRNAIKSSTRLHGIIADDGKSFQKAMELLSTGKDISIKIGVQIPDMDGLREGNDFFLEFDPTVEAMVEDHRWLFPYAAWTDTVQALPFNVHGYQWCSSIFKPSDIKTRKEALHFGRSACTSRSTESAEQQAGMCYDCQNSDMISKTLEFPAMSMRDLLERIDHKSVKLFDIDAQGADFEIVKSLGPLVRNIKTVKMECQDFSDDKNNWFLYNSNVPNNCTAARLYLERHGFELLKQETNNCGCNEYNLYMHRSGHSK